MSKKINSYLVLDFETGGLEGPVKNPVCEIGCLGINGITLEEVLRYDNVVKPYDSKLIYEEGAMKVHGLTAAVCQRDGVSLREVMKDFCLVCEETNVFQSKIARPILVGHNITYDIPFLVDIANRAQIDLSKHISGYFDKGKTGTFIPHFLDTMHLAKGADALKDDLKYNLEESCRRHASELVDGHRAMNDVIATASLFRAFLAKLRSDGGTVMASDGSGQVRKHFEI